MISGKTIHDFFQKDTNCNFVTKIDCVSPIVTVIPTYLMNMIWLYYNKSIW